ncbi:unnamed protein product [Clavelina lepadiformis]|uniref:Double-strand break repair protein n=1 Tax=Clavelina lepadiformis TaxID=159417 RepID=A0ABP0GRQ1_CLALP
MSDGNVMKILVATDLHVGYKEKDGERGKDSFLALEEVFTIAKERDVDFILLGGDLFHENKPSRKTLHRTMELFRKFCLGNRACHIEIVSDQAVNFGHTSSSVTCVNYEDPNINIKMPVFSIHGNHDDPTGAGELSAIDFLSVAGFLNHFGKPTSLEKIEISPILMQKGSTKLALYGLGSIRDERLHRLFLNKKVTFLRPSESADEWYNIFTIHQNRVKHGATNYIPEEFVEHFIDLVIWGHEHECLIKPQWNTQQSFHVMQPGSSVATSLCEAESKNKHVAVLTIDGRKMETDIIRLRTVRQMYVENVNLAESIRIKSPSREELERAARDYCNERVELLLMRAEDERSGHPKQPIKPLIRLRVDYSGGFESFNAYRFGAQFTDRVANPENIVHFLKKSQRTRSDDFDVHDMDAKIQAENIEKIKMEDLVQEYLNDKEKKDQMSLLTARGVSHAVSEFVDKQERDAISDLCSHQIKKTSEHLKKQETLEDRNEIVLEVSRFHEIRQQRQPEEMRMSRNDEEQMDVQDALERARAERESRGVRRAISSDEDTLGSRIDEMDVTATRGKRGRGATRSRGRASTRATGSRGGGARSKKTAIALNSIDSYFGNDTLTLETCQPSQSTCSSQRRKGAEVLAGKVKQEAGETVDLTLDEDGLDPWPAKRSKPKPPPSAGRSLSRKRGKGINFDDSSDEDDSRQFQSLKRNRR